MFTQPFHDFDTYNAFLSEGGALAVVEGDFHETSHRTRDNTDFPRPLRNSEARLCLAVPLPPGVTPRRTRGVLVVRATPHLFAAGAPSGAGTGGSPGGNFTGVTPLPPLAEEVALTTVIPGGKAQMKTWSQVILINLALTAVGCAGVARSLARPGRGRPA